MDIEETVLLKPDGSEFTYIYIYIYMLISPHIRDAGIAIESSGGAYVYIGDDMGWVVSVSGPCVNPTN